MKFKLNEIIKEYSEKNANNIYEPVAVGKYGIRKRSDIYKKELSDDYSKNKIIRKDTLIIGMGSTQIDIGILSDDLIFSVSPAYHTFKINTKIVNSDFLRLLFLEKNNYFTSRYMIASARQGKTVNLKDMLIDEVDIPNIETQIDYVRKISEINKLITNEIKQLELCDELVKSRFIEMFEENNKHNFPVKPLSEIATYWNGLTYKPTDVVNDENGTLVLRSSNIQNGQLSFDDNVYVNCSIKEKQYVKENDILMCSRNGSAKLVGKVALIKGLDKPTSFGAFMMIFRSEYYSYLKVYFEMPEFRSQLATGTSTINQITGGMLNGVKLPVPDMDTVNEFKTFVEQIDKSKFIIQKRIDLYKELLDKKMNEYFE